MKLKGLCRGSDSSRWIKIAELLQDASLKHFTTHIATQPLSASAAECCVVLRRGTGEFTNNKQKQQRLGALWRDDSYVTHMYCTLSVKESNIKPNIKPGKSRNVQFMSS